MSTRTRHYWWLYLAAGAILCGLYVFQAPFKGSGPVINGLGLYGVLGIAAGIRVHKPAAKTAWWFMAGGLALFFMGTSTPTAIPSCSEPMCRSHPPATRCTWASTRC